MVQCFFFKFHNCFLQASVNGKRSFPEFFEITYCTCIYFLAGGPFFPSLRRCRLLNLHLNHIVVKTVMVEKNVKTEEVMSQTEKSKLCDAWIMLNCTPGYGKSLW